MSSYGGHYSSDDGFSGREWVIVFPIGVFVVSAIIACLCIRHRRRQAALATVSPVMDVPPPPNTYDYAGSYAGAGGPPPMYVAGVPMATTVVEMHPHQQHQHAHQHYYSGGQALPAPPPGYSSSHEQSGVPIAVYNYSPNALPAQVPQGASGYGQLPPPPPAGGFTYRSEPSSPYGHGGAYTSEQPSQPAHFAHPHGIEDTKEAGDSPAGPITRF